MCSKNISSVKFRGLNPIILDEKAANRPFRRKCWYSTWERHILFGESTETTNPLVKAGQPMLSTHQKSSKHGGDLLHSKYVLKNNLEEKKENTCSTFCNTTNGEWTREGIQVIVESSPKHECGLDGMFNRTWELGEKAVLWLMLKRRSS